jgi:hypothetical protein
MAGPVADLRIRPFYDVIIIVTGRVAPIVRIPVPLVGLLLLRGHRAGGEQHKNQEYLKYSFCIHAVASTFFISSKIRIDRMKSTLFVGIQGGKHKKKNTKDRWS